MGGLEAGRRQAGGVTLTTGWEPVLGCDVELAEKFWALAQFR
jgi:hypothetical protein